tara:strand:- start:1138 stop:2157 length:1020 start_codon:yes stop_codon:yes gene_type:complete
MPFLQTFGAGSIRGFDQGLVFAQQTATFNYTGAVQTWTVPQNTQSIYAYVFGPGGGAEGNNGTNGGAGGYTVGNINPVPGSTMKIIVGGAGGNGTQDNGSGGGYSAVATPNWAGSSPSTDHAAIILAAGGGGGAAGNDLSLGAGNTTVQAGAGGGASGQDGQVNSSAPGQSGRGGTQSAGGVYPGNAGGGACTATSCSGTTLRGGTGCGGAEGSGGVGWPNQIYGGTWGSAAGGNGCNAGGGGAGYYGGSGGGHDGSTGTNAGSGGGGSGYTGGSGAYTTSNVATYTGNGRQPPSQMTNSIHWSTGIGVGGIHATVNPISGSSHYGGHGRVVLVFIAPV